MKCTICHKDMAPVSDTLFMCPTCELISCNLSADQAIYDEKYWAHYRVLGRSSLGGDINAARAGIVKMFTDGPLLDFGSGAGTFINRMKADGYEINGFDINPYSGNCVVERLFESYKGVTFWDSIEHLDAPDVILRGINTEFVFICTPNIDNFPGKDLSKWRHYKPTEHIHYFNGASLKALLEATGFEIVHTSFEESFYRKDGDQNIITVVGKRKKPQHTNRP